MINILRVINNNKWFERNGKKEEEERSSQQNAYKLSVCCVVSQKVFSFSKREVLREGEKSGRERLDRLRFMKGN